MTPQQASRNLKTYLIGAASDHGVDPSTLTRLGVKSRGLRNTGVHTWLGMLGYCSKVRIRMYFAIAVLPAMFCMLLI
jgi:hypothetical protein